MGASFAAIVTAAGSSARMWPRGGVPVKKEYLPLGPGYVDAGGDPLTVLGAAVLAFARFDEIGIIVVTVPPDGEDLARAALPRELGDCRDRSGRPSILFAGGGSTRRDSVYRALSLLGSLEWAPLWVLIHDGARPWVSADLIRRVMDAVVRHGAVIPLAPLLETPKEIGEGGVVLKHLRRSALGLAQTPQAFAFPRILQAHSWAAHRAAHERAAHERAVHERAVHERVGGFEYTDDAEIWGEFCGPVATVPGERGNRKITYMEDLA